MFSNHVSRPLRQRLLPVLLTCCSASAMALPVAVDLNTWSAHNTTSGTAGKWVVAPGGGSVTQTANASPTFFVSNNSYLNTTLRTRVRVDDNDNDLFGFVLGYKSPATNGNTMDFLLFDWRQSAQSNNGALGQPGFTLSQVNGTFNNFVPNFWGHASSPGFEVLKTSYGSTQGWGRGVDYDFTVQYDADRVRIELAGGVFGTGRTIFDMAGSFSSGGIGFYDYSQPQVRFSNVTLDVQAGNLVPEPGSIALLGLALCGLLVGRRRGDEPSARGSQPSPLPG